MPATAHGITPWPFEIMTFKTILCLHLCFGVARIPWQRRLQTLSARSSSDEANHVWLCIYRRPLLQRHRWRILRDGQMRRCL